MTQNEILMLATPVFAGVAVAATALFAVVRINRYGRVFNWPPIPEKSSPPPAVKRGDT